MVSDRQRLEGLKEKLILRARLFELVRYFFQNQGFLEVDTPLRVPTVAPETQIVPFESEGWFLTASPELHMKRLLAAGYERIFQIAHSFRHSERGRYHNPEFSLLEWYRANAGYGDIIEDSERLIVFLSERLLHSINFEYRGQLIDMASPWEHLSVRRAFIKFAGWDPVDSFDESRFDEDMAMKIIPALPLNRPIVLKDYPKEAASLARLKPGHPEVAERAEIFIGRIELVNIYSELNDRKEQTWRFTEEVARIEEIRGCRPAMPQSFLEALGMMPPAGGAALGMDRLAMLFTNAAIIDEVLAFTVDTA